MASPHHYACCRICGSLGHVARSCPLFELEQRKDPFGEAIVRVELRHQRREFQDKRLKRAADARENAA